MAKGSQEERGGTVLAEDISCASRGCKTVQHLLVRVSGSILLQSGTCSDWDGGTLCKFVMHSNADPWGCVHYIIFI